MVSGAAHTTAHDHPGVRDHPDDARHLDRVVGVLHVPRGPGAGVRRLRRRPRPHRRAAGRHRRLGGRHGGPVRHRPARGDAVVLDRPVRLGHRRRQGAHRHCWSSSAVRTCRSTGPSSTTPRSTRRSPGPSCRVGRGRPRDRVRVPRPQHRQQHLQGRPALGGRGGGGAGAAGPGTSRSTTCRGERPCATSSTRSPSPPSRPRRSGRRAASDERHRPRRQRRLVDHQVRADRPRRTPSPRDWSSASATTAPAHPHPRRHHDRAARGGRRPRRGHAPGVRPFDEASLSGAGIAAGPPR